MNDPNRLKHYRTTAGIPQAELARASGVTVTTISNIETFRCQPTARTCYRIMEGFKVLEREQSLWDVFPSMKGQI